jgi:hypothetical protein
LQDGRTLMLETDDLGSAVVGTRIHQSDIQMVTRLDKSPHQAQLRIGGLATVDDVPWANDQGKWLHQTFGPGGWGNGSPNGEAMTTVAQLLPGTEAIVEHERKFWLYRVPADLMAQYPTDASLIAAAKKAPPTGGQVIRAFIVGNTPNIRLVPVNM